MPTVSDLESAYYAQYGYTGSITDMQYQYYSNPPTLDAYGFVRVASPPGSTLSAGTANSNYYHRVIEGGTFTKIRTGIGTTSGNICIAAYKNTGSGLTAKAGNLIATTGSIPCPVAGLILDIPMGSSVTVAAGDWISLGVDNAAVTFLCTGGAGPYSGATAQFAIEGSAFPAPAVANPAIHNIRMFSLIGVP